MTPEIVLAELGDLNPDAILFDNMSSALVAVGRVGAGDLVAVYSQRRIFQQLLLDGLSREDAEEYFANKIASLSGGPNTPVILLDLVEE